MKKLILTLLTLSLIFTFCACAQTSNIDPKNDTPQILSDSNQDNISPSSENATVVSSSGGGQGCATPTPSFSSLDEYNYYVATNTLPMSFVTYQDLAEFGEFKSCVELAKGKSYFYVFNTDSGEDLALYVYYERSLQEYMSLSGINMDTDVIETHPISDLRRGGTFGKPYMQNELFYDYVNGKLLSIIWESNGVLFVLGCQYELADYDGDNVILNMLLTKGDESAQVKAAFDTMIQNKLNQAKQ